MMALAPSIINCKAEQQNPILPWETTTTMAHSPLAVANSLVLLAIEKGDPATPMKLQKLVYYANGWWLYMKKEPLISGNFQAWKYGPVCPEIYEVFRINGDGVIMNPGEGVVEELELRWGIPLVRSDEVWKHLRSIWDGYGELTGQELSQMTHAPGTAWEQVYEKGVREIPIPHDLILGEFTDKVNKVNAAT